MHELDAILDAIRRTPRGILATVVATRGSTYRRPGARAVIAEDGSVFGIVSGGCVERDLAERTAAWLADFTPRLMTYDNTALDDVVFGLGLGCRGEIDVLIEPFDAAHPPQIASFRWNGSEPVQWTTTLDGRAILTETIRPPRAIVVFGRGNDVAPVVRVAEAAGFRVTTSVNVELDLTPFDAAVVMTHNFMRDVEIVGALAKTPIAYVGLLGPKSRGDDVLANVGELPESFRARVHSPIGLDLGGERPDEIALAIVAEVQAVLNGKEARPLRDVDAPIHAIT